MKQLTLIKVAGVVVSLAAAGTAIANESLNASVSYADGGWSSSNATVTTGGVDIQHSSGTYNSTTDYAREQQIRLAASGIELSTSVRNGSDRTSTSVVLNDSGATINGDATVTGDLLISNGLEGGFEAKINVLEELQGATSTANAAYTLANETRNTADIAKRTAVCLLYTSPSPRDS